MAFDQGADFFHEQPTLMLIEVWHKASKLFADALDQHEFVAGYQRERARKDEYNREKIQ